MLFHAHQQKERLALISELSLERIFMLGQLGPNKANAALANAWTFENTKVFDRKWINLNVHETSMSLLQLPLLSQPSRSRQPTAPWCIDWLPEGKRAARIDAGGARCRGPRVFFRVACFKKSLKRQTYWEAPPFLFDSIAQPPQQNRPKQTLRGMSGMDPHLHMLQKDRRIVLGQNSCLHLSSTDICSWRDTLHGATLPATNIFAPKNGGFK